MSEKDFLAAYPVSHETLNKLQIYAALLDEWNKKFNLVASSTLPYLWTRHFLDSAQLMSFIPPEAQTLADMGSGAGFPGLVLAILAQDQNRGLRTTLIESIGKKADFLETVAKELKLNVSIQKNRIEDIRELKADVITARALKALPELFKYANYLTHRDSICLFLKGKSVGEELTEARKYWTFAQEIHPSCSDDTGQILVIRDLRYKLRR